MNMHLFETLIAKGLSTEDATSIASEHAEEPTVDTDALSKSLDGLRDTFEKGGQDEYIAELQASVEESASIVEAVSKGADAVLAEVRGQNDALSKAILAIGEELQALRGGFDTMAKGGDVLAKSIQTATSALGEPVVKSVDTLTPIPGPLDAVLNGFSGDRPDLINKALAVMQADGTPESRQRDMGQAVSLLESGANLGEVAAAYGLNN